MSLALSLLSSIKNRDIDKYVFDGSHNGKVSAVWFENNRSKEIFLQQISSTRLDNSVLIAGDSSEDLRSKLNNNNLEEAKVVVFDVPKKTEAFYELVMDFSVQNGSSVFLINDSMVSAYISDKVICVDQYGAVTDEFFTEILA